jgi:hypothetical protein
MTVWPVDRACLADFGLSTILLEFEGVFFWVHLCPLRDVLYVGQYFLVWGTPVSKALNQYLPRSHE